MSSEGGVSSYQTLHWTGKPSNNVSCNFFLFCKIVSKKRLDAWKHTHNSQRLSTQPMSSPCSYRIQNLQARKRVGICEISKYFTKKTSPVNPYFYCFNILSELKGTAREKKWKNSMEVNFYWIKMSYFSLQQKICFAEWVIPEKITPPPAPPHPYVNNPKSKY